MKMKTFRKVFMYIIIVGMLTGLFSGCNITGKDNPLPEISGISPAVRVSHMPSFVLHVTGSGFVPESVIVFDGIEKETEYIDSTHITCRVESEEIRLETAQVSAWGMVYQVDEKAAHVQVRSPQPGGGESGTMALMIEDRYEFSASRVVCGGTRPVPVTGEPGKLYLGGINWVGYGNGGNDFFLVDSSDGGRTWSDRTVLSDGSLSTNFAAIDHDNAGYLHAAWIDAQSTTAGEGQVYYSRSYDQGRTWSAPVPVHSSIEHSNPWNVRIASDGAGTVYMVWSEFQCCTGPSYVHVSVSTDNGDNWSAAHRFSQRGSNTSLAVHASGAYLVWEGFDQERQVSPLYFCRTEDRGANWTTPHALLGPQGFAQYDIAVNPVLKIGPSGTLYVVWRDYSSVKISISTDKGRRWSVPYDFAMAVESYDTQPWPRLDVDAAGNILVLWESRGADSSVTCYLSRSIDGGRTWAPNTVIHDYMLRDGHRPGFTRMATDPEGNMYMAWETVEKGVHSVEFLHSTGIE